MRQAFAVAEVREAEAALMESVPERQLMLQAAGGLARVTAGVLAGGVVGARIVALVGSGNNGGDVLFAAAALARRGAATTAVLLCDTWHADGAAALARAGGVLLSAADVDAARAAARADVLLDGIVGIGASGPLRERAAELVHTADTALVVAADIPSGVSPDTGEVSDPTRAVHADVTVTFGCLKPGLVLDPGRQLAGTVESVDIGLGPALERRRPAVSVLDAADVRPYVAEPGHEDYKYSHGIVGVVAGSDVFPGAAQMVVGAARHCGVGMVRLHSDSARWSVAQAVVARFPDVVVAESAPAQDPRATGWVVGPGTGTGPDSEEVLRSALESEHPLVVDADGLTLLARRPALRELLRDRVPPSVITPHVGEFTRLGFALSADRVESARAAAAQSGAIVVLKGSGSVIADPAGTVFADLMGTPALATAGTGDALAGIIGAVFARAGAAADAEAAAAGVYLHGLAGRLAARGGRPVTSWDVVRAVPDAVADIRS